MIQTELTNDEYHLRPYMSATKLKNLLKSPAHYKAALNMDTDTPSFRTGRMVHSFVLEPETFWDNYGIFDGDRRTKAGKAQWEEIQTGGLEPIKPDESTLCENIANACKRFFPDGGAAEVSYSAKIEGVMCQCRPDWILQSGNKATVYDLKTCIDASAADRVFYQYGYDIQSVFYRMVLEACGVEVSEMQFVFVEKSAPFDVALRVIDPLVEDPVRADIYDALNRFKVCMETDTWPGVEGPNPEARIAEAPAWKTKELDLSGFYSTENECC